MEPLLDKPLRADARRNRDAILAAAKSVFAKHGADAQMDDIARKAKLGVGTLYRHFPTKNALIEALVADRFEQIAGFLREGLEQEDPFEGLCRSMWRGAELAERDRGVSQLFGEHIQKAAAVQLAQGEVLQLADRLVAAAKAAGALRDDFQATDIPVIMCGVVEGMKMGAFGNWQRHLRLIFEGMRARPDALRLDSPA